MGAFRRINSIASVLRVLTPTYFTVDPLSSNDAVTSGAQQLRLTTLDGLRGIACLIVVHHHSCKQLGTIMFWSATWWGIPLWFEAPWIHTFFAGRPMVWIFWVVSGYLMSYKPLRLMASTDHHKFSTSIGASLFRRGPRLYFPALAALLLFSILIFVGLGEHAQSIREDPTRGNWLDLSEDLPPRKASLFSQLGDILWSARNLFNIWDVRNNNSALEIRPGPYNDHYWIISAQYRSSLLLTLVLLVGSRLGKNFSSSLYWLLAILSYTVWNRADLFTHVAGLSLADVDVRRTVGASLSMDFPASKESRSVQPKGLPQPILWIMFIIGTLLTSIPLGDAAHQPITHYITQHVPLMWWPDPLANDGPCALGAVLTVYAVLHLKPLQHIMNSKIALYFGKISFSMYLVHGFILRTWLWSLLPWIYGLAGRSEALSKEPQYTAFEFLVVWGGTVLAMIPMVIVVGDLFHRKVEVPCTRLAASIEKIALKQS